MQKKHYLTTILFFFFFSIIFGNTIDPTLLNKEILENNSNKKFDVSIKRLTEIINNPSSTNYDLYNAYLQKYITFKSLFNYPEAKENLDLAEKYGLKSNKVSEVKTRIGIERVFVEFDLGNHDKAKQLISEIKDENISLVDSETQAFYYSVLGTFEIRNKNYSKADIYFDKAIEILKIGNPKHIANIYRAKMGLYTELRDHDKLINAFEIGIASAEENNMEVYILNLYEHLTHYYAEIGDFKKAYENRTIVNNLATKYDALNISGKVLLLEKELINEYNNEILEYEKNKQLLLITIATVLILLIVVLYLLYRSNREKRKFIEIENQRMREELSLLSKEFKDKGETIINLKSYNLSERQIDIIKLVEKGKTNKEIGAELFISENTVKYHLKNIYNTLGIDNRNSLIKK